jgi:hypothetical protein
MSYEVFDSKAVRIGSPSLTITTDGRIGLNADVGDILASVGAKYVQILWDRENCRLAIRPLTKSDQRAFKLTFLQGRRGAGFSAQSFLNYIQWKPVDRFNTQVHWNDKDGLLEAVLPKERIGTVDRPNDRKRR